MKYFCGESCCRRSEEQLRPQKYFAKPPQFIFRTPDMMGVWPLSEPSGSCVAVRPTVTVVP